MKRLLVVIAVLALALLVTWRVGVFAPKPPPPAAPPAGAAPEPPRAGQHPAAPPAPAAPTADEPSSLAAELNSPTTDIRSDLSIVSDVVEAFRTNFPRDGNPIGDNAEITAALAGRNKLGLVLISPRHPAINARGELCDRWGTPFFFHAVSGTRMEIRSAGPDRKMWTDDDAVFAP